ncbi:hypothetical protein ABES23_06180 [Peribacillus frigoritolerans]|uniref:hypothetical protein n=1 Tax=Peribacillus frigoritolerans TaxID=450367 RepID=UPI003D2970E0
MSVQKNKYEIISKEEIYEPTGEFQESGREIIFTRKTVTKYGKLTITTKSNEPSPEAIANFKRLLYQKAEEILLNSEKRKNKNANL